MLKKACNKIVVVMRMPPAGKRIVAAEGGAQAAHAKHRKQQHNEHGADETKLLAMLAKMKSVAASGR